MKNMPSSDHIESTNLGWKFIFIVAALTTVFFTFLYLAMTSKPDYMLKPKEVTQQQNPPSSTPPKTEKDLPK